MIFGVGKLGGPLADLLASKFPTHRYVLVSRSEERATKRANLTRYVCAQWNAYPYVLGAGTDLRDTDQTAGLVDRFSPDIVFNATTPFPWWKISDLPPELEIKATEAGPGVWCALDVLLPELLRKALANRSERPIFVNGCYPDMVNAFLAETPACPVVGIGNISNLIPGLTLAFAEGLAVDARNLRLQLVCHHYTSLNAPSLGGPGGAPYFLAVEYPEGRLVYDGDTSAPFEPLHQRFSRVRGLDGQGVTVSSAATVLASLLNNESKRHHAPGPLGLIGGYPIETTPAGKIHLDLPAELSIHDAIDINARAQRFDGVDSVSSGRVRLTSTAAEALQAICGIELSEVSLESMRPIADEILQRLDSRYSLGLRAP